MMKTKDLPAVAAMLGHRDIKTTMIYAHLTQDHIKMQMGKLDDVAIPKICPKSAQNLLKAKKGKSAESRFPFGIVMVPKGGLEPPRVSPPPPQGGPHGDSEEAGAVPVFSHRPSTMTHSPRIGDYSEIRSRLVPIPLSQDAIFGIFCPPQYANIFKNHGDLRSF